ncbi:MAG: glycosyltransferase 87 family protein, partial [Candidatus Bathyarchaeia archaeon]
MKPLSLRRVLVFSLLSRLVLSPLTGHPWDLKVWLDVGKRVTEGDMNLYSLNGRPEWMWGYYAYPPGWMGWCGLAYLFNFNIHLYAIVLKLPIILSDLATGYLIYLTLRRLGQSEAESTCGAALYFLNPVSILISSVWGMFDAIPAMLTIMALNLFMEKSELRAGILLGLSILFKLYPVFLILAFLGQARQSGTTPRKLLGFLSTTAAIPLVASIPFILRDFKGYVNALLSHAAPSGYMSLWFTISHLFHPLKEKSGVLFLTMFIALNVFVFRRLSLSRGLNNESIYLTSLLIMLCFFIASPKVNPQYVVWLLPLAIIDFTTRRSVFKYGSLSGMTALTSLIITGAVTVNNSFLLVDVGFPDPAVVQSSMAAIAISSILFPILCLAYFRRTLTLGVYRPRWPGRLGVTLILIILPLSYFTAPIPKKVDVKTPFILSMPESPATGFTPMLAEYGVREFQSKYRSDGVVLLFGPDFINTYSGYDPDRDVRMFFKAYYYDEWTQRSVRELVRNLHEERVKAYLGIFTLKDYLVDGRGYVSPWLNNHSEVVDDNLLRFDKTLLENGSSQAYYVYFSEKTLRVVVDFNFDGVAI